MKEVPTQITDLAAANTLLQKLLKTIDTLNAQIIKQQSRIDQLIGMLYGKKAEKRSSNTSKPSSKDHIPTQPANGHPKNHLIKMAGVNYHQIWLE
jgi:hypothetical protein